MKYAINNSDADISYNRNKVHQKHRVPYTIMKTPAAKQTYRLPSPKNAIISPVSQHKYNEPMLLDPIIQQINELGFG